MKKYSIETLGTFFLVLTVLVTGKPIAIGLVVCALMYVGHSISGGHFNPAVTLAAWIRGRCATKLVPGYMASQFLGAFIAAFMFYIFVGKIVYPAPLATIATWKTILIEALGTFVLCSVALKTAEEPNTGSLQPSLMVGLSLAAAIFICGPLSGGAVNPAVGLGPILFDTLKKGTSYPLLMIYLTGPFLGGLFAGFFSYFMKKD